MSESKVKLFTLWAGDLPEWMSQFEDRLRANHLIDWELLHWSVEEANTLVGKWVGTLCRKETPYALGDLRPLLGGVCSERLIGYDWWGWVDLDVVLGDLDRLLPPLLYRYDVISTDAKGIHGPLTLLRNVPAVNLLCREGGLPEAAIRPEVAEMLGDRDYWNYDEDGFEELPFCTNPSFTRLVRDAERERGLRVCWDNRSWTENRETIEGGLPSRCCELLPYPTRSPKPRGTRLLEKPTKREILLYHFTGCTPDHKKVWPVPHPAYERYDSLAECQEKYWRNRPRRPVLPPAPTALDPASVESPEYWAARINRVLEANGPLHQVVCDTPPGDWEYIQSRAAEIMASTILPNRPGQRILDGGCSYGTLLGPLLASVPDFGMYVGVDYCSPMVDLARRMWPSSSRILFLPGDLHNLPFTDDTFDWAVCRGVEGTTRVQLGNRVWARMRDEMLRVARRLLLIHLDGRHQVIERINATP